MCLLGMLTGRYAATAKVNDGRLVLSLPDAETPVVWVMDLNDTATSVLRLESDKQGFYVIKKHGGKVAPETVAVYRNRRPAVHALNRATRALDKARLGHGSAGNGRSRTINVLIVILFIWFALSRFWSIDQDLMRMALLPFFRDDLAAAQMDAQAQALYGAPATGTETAPQAPAAPQNNPEAVGVPLSADDFLKFQADKPDSNLMMP